MGVSQVKQERTKRGRSFYLIGGFSFLLTVLLVFAAIYLWEEMQQAQAYGYVGEFLVSVPAGITIVPAPALPVTFTLGRILNPVYVGLVSGFGEALGGITVYLTGTGVENVWSRLRIRTQRPENQPGPGYDLVQPVQSKLWSKGQAIYNRLSHWVGGRAGSLVVFIAAAVPLLSLFYPAGLAAGSLRMGLPRFFLSSWAGKTVKGLIVAFAGYWGLFFLPQ